MITLILANDAEMILSSATYNKHYVVNCISAAEWQTRRNMMTPENLSDVKLYDGGAEVAHITNLTLTGTQEVINSDGTITGHFYLSGGSNLTTDYAEAGKILMGDEEE